MSALSVPQFAVLAEGAPAQHPYEHLNPVLNGVTAFGVLMLLLFLTSRLNRDR